MESIYIVTDNSTQFPYPSYPGINLVHIVPLSWNPGQKIELEYPSPLSFSPNACADFCPKLTAPTIEQFYRLFDELINSHHKILGIFLSSKLSDCYHNAEAAAQLLRKDDDIQVVDSQTTSAGLGILVQKVARLIAEGTTLLEAAKYIRSLILKSYAILCIPCLSYLHYNGYMDQIQALVGEMLGILPIFMLEEGVLAPVEKLRSTKQIYGTFQEFLDEFVKLDFITLIQSIHASLPDSNINFIMEYAQKSFPSAIVTTQFINYQLANLFGPNCTALFVLENRV